MSKILKLTVLWQRVEPGKGFFVPCLDAEKVKEEGLRAAVPLRLKKATATIGIKDGKYGVWFSLPA